MSNKEMATQKEIRIVYSNKCEVIEKIVNVLYIIDLSACVSYFLNRYSKVIEPSVLTAISCICFALTCFINGGLYIYKYLSAKLSGFSFGVEHKDIKTSETSLAEAYLEEHKTLLLNKGIANLCIGAVMFSLSVLYFL